MRILPVLDLKQGQIVRGIAGRRDEYQPIVSTLTRSTRPVAVARALHEHFGFSEFYLADLDAIRGESPAYGVLENLAAEGLKLWVDGGVRTVNDAGIFLAVGAVNVVVGLETLQGPKVLREIWRQIGPRQVVFSLDLKDGQPLGNLAAWGVNHAWAIAQRAIEIGVVRLIILDLAHVGVGAGTGTEELCARLRREHPDIEIATGGGIRSIDDIWQLDACGVDIVLVASALHDGRLTADSVQSIHAEYQRQRRSHP
jgi:phosphoribosylformimino-5-aminoimidazole carboxamide ribotide isomerase